MTRLLFVDDEVLLRQLTLDDAEELFALIDTNREHLGRWLPWVTAITSVDDERGFLRLQRRRADELAEIDFAIRAGNQIVGCAGLANLDSASGMAEVGYWLAQDAQGRGYATRAVQALTRYARELGHSRIELHVATDNQPSRAVAERLGFALAEIRPLGMVVGVDARVEDLAVYALDVT